MVENEYWKNTCTVSLIKDTYKFDNKVKSTNIYMVPIIVMVVKENISPK